MKPWEQTWTVRDHGKGRMVLAKGGEAIWYTGPHRIEDVEGREHLIAAAPELYRALECMSSVVPACYPEDSMIARAQQQAAAALRKAKGEP